ncbi:MAG: hypothetical protein KC505_01125 [Myxococcales bacterium]|nr:hypothetical protein [Myxococcales bacterium]USN50838.1 MAG: hypothetical protein H6731_11405 [Myxococcales bacterium]
MKKFTILFLCSKFIYTTHPGIAHYTDNVETGIAVSSENFYNEISFKKNIFNLNSPTERLSINNIPFLKLTFPHYKDELSIIKHFFYKGVGCLNENKIRAPSLYSKIKFFTPKDEIEFVEMSEIKVLKPGNIFGKSSLVTTHVIPCVVITAHNKRNNYIGLAHMPGSPIDLKLKEGVNPLSSYWENTDFERIKENLLKKSIKYFLQMLTDDNIENSDMLINIFGGALNRLLLIQIINFLDKFQIKVDINCIHPGKFLSNEERIKFSFENDRLRQNIEINSGGEVFLLKHHSVLNKKIKFDNKEAVRHQKLPLEILSEIDYSRVPSFFYQVRKERLAQFTKIYVKFLGTEVIPNTYITSESQEIAKDLFTHYSPLFGDIIRFEELIERVSLLFHLQNNGFIGLYHDDTLNLKKISLELQEILESLSAREFEDTCGIIYTIMSLGIQIPKFLSAMENGNYNSKQFKDFYSEELAPLIKILSPNESLFNEQIIGRLKRGTFKHLKKMTSPKKLIVTG